MYGSIIRIMPILKFQLYTKPWIKTETASDKKKRAAQIIRALETSYPNANMALKFGNNIQLLVAVMLSAQCTDKKVNEVTTSLFKKYKTARDFATANKLEFEKEIHQTGFYRAKTKNIIATCKKIQQEFDGRLPRAMADILTLPGVARKTANVVLGNAPGVGEGIAVDTHALRITQRLGLTTEIDPVKIERDLMSLFPKTEWFKLTYKIIEHGRALCEAKKPKCAECPLKKLCPSALV